MAMGVNNFNYETQGPSVVWAFSKVLRKIYPDDDEYVAALDNHFKYFNTTTAMAGMILGQRWPWKNMMALSPKMRFRR